MKLKLVKKGRFLGSVCDFYMNEEREIFMSRTQLGCALKYFNPSKAIENIHNRNFEYMRGKSIEITGAQIEGSIYKNKNAKKIYMYNEKGIYAIVRKSNMPVSDEYFDWVYEVIHSIKVNGYYITNEKDENWFGIRAEGKKVRRGFTDEIQEFVYYAISQGSNKPQMYYKHFTELVRKKLGIPKDVKRDELNQSELFDMQALERVISMKLPKLIDKDMNYKEIYRKIKELIDII
ncbi:TPA: BRO family protein [Clostridioides difficile]